jgi:hypothetical protein
VTPSKSWRNQEDFLFPSTVFLFNLFLSL